MARTFKCPRCGEEYPEGARHNCPLDPSAALHHIADRRLRDAVERRQRAVANPRAVGGANGGYVAAAEPRPAVPLASGALRERRLRRLDPVQGWSRAALTVPVPVVVGARAEEQVVGTNAEGHVAMVEDTEPRRDRPVSECPGEPVRELPPLAYAQVAVAMSRRFSLPKPAA